MSKEKEPKEITIWLWSLLIACVMALSFAILYLIFYTFPEYHEASKNFFGSAGTGQLATPKEAINAFFEIILIGTPFARFLLLVVDNMDNKKGGAE